MRAIIRTITTGAIAKVYYTAYFTESSITLKIAKLLIVIKRKGINITIFTFYATLDGLIEIYFMDYFTKAKAYLSALDSAKADPLDRKAKELIEDGVAYERASQALRRKFSRGAVNVESVDRGGRETSIKREKVGGKYRYMIQGADGNWFEPDERIWVVSMYALWQDSK